MNCEAQSTPIRYVVTEKDFALISEAITAYKAAKNKKLHLKNLKKQKVVAEM